MDPTELHIDPERIGALCAEYDVARLELFGSLARGDASPTSDVDLLVTFKPEVRIGLEFVALQQELESLFGRSVDTPHARVSGALAEQVLPALRTAEGRDPVRMCLTPANAISLASSESLHRRTAQP